MRYLLLVCCLFIMACQKEALQHEADLQLIQQYLADNNLDAAATVDSNADFSYVLFAAGDSVSPVRNAGIEIKVKYKVYLLDGTIIRDTYDNTEILKLDDAIYGLQLAMPNMSIKDSMRLFLPSRLAYGEAGYTPSDTTSLAVPPNTVLAFDIKLIDIYPHF
jgi:FKBP-type peptidyl-prolyl cis-trans isomerase